MLGIPKRTPEEDNLAKMTAFEAGEDLSIGRKKKNFVEEESLDLSTDESVLPKVRVRHPRIVGGDGKKTAVEDEDESVFAFKGKNLFNMPEAEESESSDSLINMFGMDEEEQEDAVKAEEAPLMQLFNQSDSTKNVEEDEAQDSLVAGQDSMLNQKETASEQPIVPRETQENKGEFIEELPSIEELTPVREDAAIPDSKSTATHNTSVSDKVIRSVQNFLKLNSGLSTDDVEIRYTSDDIEQVELLKDGGILLPNKRVYFGPIEEAWDELSEVRVPRGKELELELGVSFILPDNFALEFLSTDLMRDKHGLELADGKVLLTRQEAFLPVVLKLRSVSDVSYVSKFGKIVQCRLKQLD